LQEYTDAYLWQIHNNNRMHGHFLKVLTILSLVVVLCVSWGLKLTGITLAGEAFCGMDEHVHGDDCPTGILTCTLVETEPHTHSEACIYRELTCTEQEREGHIHTSECKEKQLLCTKQTQEGHVHTDDCRNRTLICEETEQQGHTHSSACWQSDLICTQQESEGHSHTSGCYQEEQVCTLTEDESHTHSGSCRTEQLICEIPEASSHAHGDSCYKKTLICTEKELAGHTHDTSCYHVEASYTCGIHVHGEACYDDETVYVCGLTEEEGHTHEDDCYRIGIGFDCGAAEAEGHTHTQECITGETRVACGMEATEGHAHTEECYETLEVCPLEEHIHDESCYSDIHADLETSDDWEMSLAGLIRSASTAENVVIVARSQLGNGESTLNFQVDVNGVRRGITRYGQWYGNPYGDWSAMFVSFCLHYAGVEDMPANAGPESMRIEWEKAELYIQEEAYSPKLGNLLFLHKETEQTEEESAEEARLLALGETLPANAVAIITGLEDNTITVIEGDLDNMVAETTYSVEDPAILGYGLVPEVSDYAALVEAPEGYVLIAQTIPYDESMFNDTSSFVVYTTSGRNSYAFDGIGNAVPILIDNGSIYTNTSYPDALLWTFSGSSGTYLIQNLSTGRYMHAYPNNGTGVTTSGAYTSVLIPSGDGVRIRSNSEYARLDEANGKFVVTQSAGSVYQFGYVSRCTVWLDGTCGGLMSLGGSPDKSYAVMEGGTLTLPTEWQSPDKYNYVLRGWYDVRNQRYYAPGAQVEVTENMMFYADWVATTYNVGQYNAHVADTVSTSSFVTTRVFDYNPLFNVMSQNAVVTANAAGHSETWTLIPEGGDVDHGQGDSLDFIFVDYDGNGDISYPTDRNGRNTSGGVYSGLYNGTLRDILFSTGNEINPQTGEGIIGKHYVGSGDHLFQFMSDPGHEFFGYYYYDSHRNAASYNQSAGRFYVYDYLEGTTDSMGTDSPSDFLPFNSPYANTNGKYTRTYTYNGIDGEYAGVNHVQYDAKYNTAGNSTDYVTTNYGFGMEIDVEFYLPNQPGRRDADGTYGNQDLYGNDMHFHFSGDDDLWVLIDGKLVLDVGGVHGEKEGDINFATGVVTVDGQVDTALSAVLAAVQPGEHVLTIMYLERGSSQSNCAIYFNLAPRFSLTIQKEDVLTQELLNGAQFSVYTDAACQTPAELYSSEAAHDAGAAPTNTFTVENGVARIWGFSSGNTYYIKETRPPTAASYGVANGIIRLTIDKKGIATYDVEIIDDGNNGISGGFTVHGIRIDEETQSAYIVATNAQEWVKDITTVQVYKQWQDNLDHSDSYVTVYLTVTDPDGTVRRIREILLSQENDWQYTWTNLPKYAADGITPIQYGIEEAYQPGYQPKVEKVDEFVIVNETWAEAYSLQNGQTYVLKTANGCLSSTGAGADTGFKWVSEETAKSSPYALWTVHTRGNTFKLTNGAAQTISFYYNNGNPSDFFSYTSGENNASKQYFRYTTASNGIRIYYDAPNNRDYYLTGTMNSSSKFTYTTTANNGQIYVPLTKVRTTHTEAVSGLGFQVTNIPLKEETSLTVQKFWENPLGNDPTKYQTEQVTIRLLANGVDTGRTVTLNLKNGWTDTFRGLPYKDENGSVISYTIEENWVTDQWIPSYGVIETHNGTIPVYSTTVTNVYRAGGPELPSTGTAARMLYILCGGSIMLASLVYGFASRRRQERRR